MRPSKQRSRSKSNRQKSLGNIVNRVFDSSGPEGKVRGTPQQIIDKYLILARDAQLGNDRVAAENFLQHAEHYTRMLSEAQREAQAEADTRRQQQEAQASRERQQAGQHGQRSGDGGGDPAQNGQNQRRDVSDPRGQDAASDEQGGSMLVDTPESDAPGGRQHPSGTDAVTTPPEQPAEKSRARNTRKPRSKPAAEAPADTAADTAAEAGGEAGGEVASEPLAKPAPRRRVARKPRAAPGAQPQEGSADESGRDDGTGGSQGDVPPRSAAG